MSLTDSLRSATYNPEAEKQMQVEREKAEKVRQEIQKWLDDYTKAYLDNFASKSYWPKWTLTTMDKLIKDTNKWLSSNSKATEVEYKAKLDALRKEAQSILEKNIYLFSISCYAKVMKFMIGEFERKKLLNAKERAQYKEYADEVEAFNTKLSKQTDPDFAEMKIFAAQFTKKVEDFSKPRGIWDQQDTLLRTAFFNPEKFEADFKTLETQAEAAQAVEDKKFSFQRFTKKVTGTAGSVIGSLLYLTFCLVIGMMAANQAIGREPKYRILYFIYGAIFAPFLVFYYIYLWFNDKSPKIYTMLPITQMKAETTIGKFLLFPFAYTEDKTARDLMVEFLTESAEMVGKKFDPKSLGSLGQQVETITENLKNLAADTKEAVEETAKAAEQALPKLNALRVNA